jgi:hypothetical protein
VAEQLDVVTRTYDLILWLLPHVAKFPRSHRFTVGDRLESLALDVLDQLVEAQYRSRKLQVLHDTNTKLERLRFMIRLSRDLKLLGARQYEFAARAVDEIGALLGPAGQSLGIAPAQGRIPRASPSRPALGPELATVPAEYQPGPGGRW